MTATIDLRSDTITRPTRAMRQAMADAEVGDDVYNDDPTVHRLQDRVAELIGTEAALFVASGTMANQIALRAQTQPGDEIVIGKEAHVWRFEAGSLAALAGVQTYQTPDFLFTADDVRRAHKAGSDVHLSLTKVVAIENTHNMAGGVCWERGQLTDVIETAHGLGLAVHLDGARLWNAAVATRTSERELAAGFDTVSVCLSKGLGAPIGSLICGKRELIARCMKLRKMYGGGWRQAGLLAAAGLHAIEHHRARLADDHANARAMAERLAESPSIVIDPSAIQTNIVMFGLARGTPAQVVERARAQGVLLNATTGNRVRAVTHLDVDRAAVLRAAELIVEIARSAQSPEAAAGS
ncbi:MAG TPA: GntG family PLP-dependent aldolase [Kofleriaceae bacterium]